MVAIDLAAFCLEASSDAQEQLTLRAVMLNPVFAEGPMQVDLGLVFSAEATDIGTTAEIKVHVIDADAKELDSLSITWRIDGKGPGGATIAGFPMWRAFAVSLKKLAVRPGLHRVDVSVDGSVKRQLPFMVLPRA